MTIKLLDGIPVELIQHGDVASATAGSIIFAPYSWYSAEPLQWGIKVGDGRDVFAITDWHSGHSKAGTIVTPRNDRPAFFVAGGGGVTTRLYLNQDARLIDAPSTHEGAGGLLGFGENGLTLLSRAPDPHWNTHRAFWINPRTWGAEEPARAKPEAWTFDWHVVLSFNDSHRVRYVIARTT